jgi:hypothetical protein
MNRAILLGEKWQKWPDFMIISIRGTGASDEILYQIPSFGSELNRADTCNLTVARARSPDLSLSMRNICEIESGPPRHFGLASAVDVLS